MEKHRIGKDFFYTFTLTDNTGAAIDFTNAKNIVLEVYRDSAFTSVQNYSITDNKVTFQWSSAENKKLGIYNLRMQWDLVNSNSETGYMHNFADKKNIFQIVTSSEDETESDAVNLTVTQYGGIDGKSAYELAVANGFTGTITEWLASLQGKNGADGSDANVTKENIEKVLVGDITTHNHNTQIAAVLTDYVMKVQGKGLSTNDLTDELLSKLNSLSNYDDTTIKNSVSSLQTQLNTLLSGNASTAIESFNEIVSFLKNVSDSETLEGIIAGITQTITDSVNSHNTSNTAHSDIRTLISDEVTRASSKENNLNKILNDLQNMTANFMIVGMAKISGNAEPDGSKFFGKDENISLIFNHLRIGLVKSPDGKLYKWCDKLRLTKATDGNSLSIDGTDGDVMLCTDCDLYLYMNNASIDSVEYEIMAIGMVPFSMYGIEAEKINKFAISPHKCVTCKLASDALTQIHSIYNLNVIPFTPANVGVFKTSLYSNSAGMSDSNGGFINNLVNAQNKNGVSSLNNPYMGLYYKYYELICAMIYIEGKTLFTMSADKLGCGNNSLNSIIGNFNMTSGASGVKIITSDGTVYYRQLNDLFTFNSANYWFNYGLISNSFSIESILEHQRVVDNIKKNDNQNNIGESYVYTDEGETLISDGSVNVINGTGMIAGKKYYTIRGVEGFESIKDNVMTCVINCFILMEFNDGVKIDSNSLDGAKIIYKLSFPLYRGFSLPYETFVLLQGLYPELHSDSNGVLSTSILSSDKPENNQSINSNSTYYGKETDILDFEKGLNIKAVGLPALTNYGKIRNLSISFFHPITFGGNMLTYDCLYNQRNTCSGKGTNGVPEKGYKCLQTLAVGWSYNMGPFASIASSLSHSAFNYTSIAFSNGFSCINLKTD